MVNAKPSNLGLSKSSIVADEIERLHEENICDVCAGSGEPVSGEPCMCMGSGKMSVAAVYLRENSRALREKLRKAGATFEQIRARIPNYPHSCPGSNCITCNWEGLSDLIVEALRALDGGGGRR
jgi:hypothetical protein